MARAPMMDDENSPADIAQDKRDAKRKGMMQSQYEGSPDDQRKDAARQRRPNNPHGNAGYHPSTAPYEHEGPTHSSKTR